MPLNEYNIILNSFGIEKSKPKEFTTTGLKEITTSSGKYNPSSAEPGDSLGLSTIKDLSVLGTPVFGKLYILPGVYFKYIGKKKIPVPYGALSLDTVLMTISMSKRIVSTEIQGRNGTIKEYISNGDFSVNIKGSLVDNSASKYPLEQVALLRSICEAPEAIKVASDFLGLFSITHLVIQSYSLSQSEGYHNVQLFDLSCVSDTPIDFNIKDIL